jgi:NTE family protein
MRGAVRPGSIGLVLSGGGARGAYEVGVLAWIAEHLPQLLDRVTVIAGTSVGAVNGAFLASKGISPEGVRELASIWRSLRIDEFVSVSRMGTLRLLGAASLRMFGTRRPSPTSSLLSVERIARVVVENTDWRGVHRAIRTGRLEALAVAATEVASGRTHLFVESHADRAARRSDSSIRRVLDGTQLSSLRSVVMAPSHVLASAAIPFFFPPVEIGGLWYVDGGLRHNTPIAPALELGAERLLLVTVRSSSPVSAASEGFPGIGQVLGKVLDSVFLDRVSFDVDRLRVMNEVVAAIERLGPDVLARFHAEMRAAHLPPYRHVDFALVRPRRDLGVLAAEHLARNPGDNASFLRVLGALFEDDAGATADAASFFLFDGSFAATLIDEGWRDAAESRATLEALIA